MITDLEVLENINLFSYSSVSQKSEQVSLGSNQGISRAACLSGGFKGKSIFWLFLASKGAHIPRLMAAFAILTLAMAVGVFLWMLSTPNSSVSSFKNPVVTQGPPYNPGLSLYFTNNQLATLVQSVTLISP